MFSKPKRLSKIKKWSGMTPFLCLANWFTTMWWYFALQQMNGQECINEAWAVTTKTTYKRLPWVQIGPSSMGKHCYLRLSCKCSLLYSTGSYLVYSLDNNKTHFPSYNGTSNVVRMPEDWSACHTTIATKPLPVTDVTVTTKIGSIIYEVETLKYEK